MLYAKIVNERTEHFIEQQSGFALPNFDFELSPMMFVYPDDEIGGVFIPKDEFRQKYRWLDRSPNDNAVRESHLQIMWFNPASGDVLPSVVTDVDTLGEILLSSPGPTVFFIVGHDAEEFIETNFKAT